MKKLIETNIVFILKKVFFIISIYKWYLAWNCVPNWAVRNLQDIKRYDKIVPMINNDLFLLHFWTALSELKHFDVLNFQ